MSRSQNKEPMEKHSPQRSPMRRRLLKVLAYCERARVALIRAWDRVTEPFEKVWAAVARHPVSPLLYVTVLALVIGTVAFDGMYTRAYVVNVDGQELGVVATEEELDLILSHVESRVASVLGEEYDYKANVELIPAYTPVDSGSDAERMEEELFSSVGALVEAWALSVNGNELGYAAAEEDLQALLDEIAQPYKTEDTVECGFVEDVKIYPVELPANTVYRLDDLKSTLTACTVEEAFYTIEKGNTFNAVAYSLDMTPAQLKALNPEVEVNKLYVGQKLVIQQAVPFLSVVTVTDETYEEVVESPIEYIESSSFYIGDTSVKSRGEDGLARVNAQVTYVNGVESERTVMSSLILEEATTTYIYKGTTPKPATASKGYYIWPVRGTITSKYGNRYIFGAYSVHSGLDIGAAYGTTVKAADGGKVTFSGWKGSYGNLVIITHDNGSQTYYAHNSSLLVKAGEKVYQGQAIAKVGSTGTSTGNHCHFEIRIKGRTVDPLKYLP